ncbi:hypoxanthine phosphoribosyltransferase [Clostridia bacterium]|nr:hypoxanthine phosphoribosyltransferase [Clostridia bacterium]
MNNISNNDSRPPGSYSDGNLGEVLLSKEAIRTAVEALGKRISDDYAGSRCLTLICVLKGAVVFFSDLIREITVPVTIEFITAKSYGNSSVSAGEVQIVKDIDTDIKGRDVILIEDISDTARTLTSLISKLKKREPNSIKTAVLLDKPSRREVSFVPDYTCFQVGNEFIVGYGLDFAEKYRNLPDIATLIAY